MTAAPTPAARMVIVESPYVGDIEANLGYARAAMLDCLNRGEAPFASHLLYTQVLDDTIEEQRDLGINAGLAIAARADATVVYTDHGISPGMARGVTDAENAGRPVEYRSLRAAALAPSPGL